MDYKRVEELAAKLRPLHKPEALMERAKKDLDEIIPGGVQTFCRAKTVMETEDIASAMVGMIFMMKGRHEAAVVDFVDAAIQLTCQALIAKEQEK